MVKLKSDRRSEPRPDSEDRRSFPRPPLWLNLALLALAAAVGLVAMTHRGSLEEKAEQVLLAEESTPVEVNEVKAELSRLDLTAEQLRKELEAREELIANLEEEQFYLAVDSDQKKLYFQYADKILRELDLQVGEELEIESADGGQPWHFVPLKGAFEVEKKSYNANWEAQEWAYLMNGEEVPETLPSIEGGLGRYVIHLPHDYVIHTEPAEASPLKGAKPGSFLVSERDMRAIWPRITKGMKVYLY